MREIQKKCTESLVCAFSILGKGVYLKDFLFAPISGAWTHKKIYHMRVYKTKAVKLLQLCLHSKTSHWRWFDSLIVFQPHFRCKGRHFRSTFSFGDFHHKPRSLFAFCRKESYITLHFTGLFRHLFHRWSCRTYYNRREYKTEWAETVNLSRWWASNESSIDEDETSSWHSNAH